MSRAPTFTQNFRFIIDNIDQFKSIFNDIKLYSSIIEHSVSYANLLSLANKVENSTPGDKTKESSSLFSRVDYCDDDVINIIDLLNADMNNDLYDHIVYVCQIPNKYCSHFKYIYNLHNDQPDSVNILNNAIFNSIQDAVNSMNHVQQIKECEHFPAEECPTDDQHEECPTDDQHEECLSDEEHEKCPTDDQHEECLSDENDEECPDEECPSDEKDVQFGSNNEKEECKTKPESQTPNHKSDNSSGIEIENEEDYLTSHTLFGNNITEPDLGYHHFYKVLYDKLDYLNQKYPTNDGYDTFKLYNMIIHNEIGISGYESKKKTCDYFMIKNEFWNTPHEFVYNRNDMHELYNLMMTIMRYNENDYMKQFANNNSMYETIFYALMCIGKEKTLKLYPMHARMIDNVYLSILEK